MDGKSMLILINGGENDAGVPAMRFKALPGASLEIPLWPDRAEL